MIEYTVTLDHLRAALAAMPPPLRPVKPVQIERFLREVLEGHGKSGLKLLMEQFTVARTVEQAETIRRLYPKESIGWTPMDSEDFGAVPS